MTPKKSSYIKVFTLFLLIVAESGVAVALINRYLRLNGMASSGTLVILMAILVTIYFVTWRWFCRKLKAIENR